MELGSERLHWRLGRAAESCACYCDRTRRGLDGCTKKSLFPHSLGGWKAQALNASRFDCLVLTALGSPDGVFSPYPWEGEDAVKS